MVDFESEISLIIQTFNSVSRDIQETIQKGGVGTVLSQRQLNVLALFVEKMDSSSGMATHVWKKEEIDFWKQKLLEDLNKLTRALEIYLSDYISNFYAGKWTARYKKLAIFGQNFIVQLYMYISEDIRRTSVFGV